MTKLPGGLVVRCFHHDKVAHVASDLTKTAPVHHSHDGAKSLQLTDLEISYHQAGTLDRLLGRNPAPPATVADVNLTVTGGETIGIVGESGSGKSTILKAIAGLLTPSGGDIRVAGDTRLPDSVDRRQPEQLRRIQMVFQNPDESLNPRQTVAQIIAQPLRLYYHLHGQALHDRSVEILETVRLGAHYMDRLPNQLSGGEKQRVAIARAFAADPEIVLCDEVTSALDVSVQAAVLELLDELKRSKNTTYLFVSHDLAVVRALSDRVAVLYQGRVCEVGPTENVYTAPWHPYTEVLMNAVLEPDPDTAPKLSAEDVVELSPPARGCPFQRRCPRKLGAICDTETPPWRDGGNEHLIRCHIAQEDL